jgi:DNA-binding beta-propeller fold protein YncE
MNNFAKTFAKPFAKSSTVTFVPQFFNHLACLSLAVLLQAAASIATAQTAVVLNSKDASLSVIDIATGKINVVNGVGKEPHHLYPSPDGKQLWVANAQSDDLVKINPITGATLQRVKGIADPYQLGFTDDGKWFISISLRLNRVDIYTHVASAAGDTFKLIKRIPTGSMPSHTVFSRDQKTAYVTLQGDNELIAIDMATQSIVWKTPLGKTPAGLWLTPSGMVLVGIMGEDYVQVIDPAKRTTLKKITTGKGAHAFRGRGDGKTVFVSNRDANMISAIDMDTLSKSFDIATASGPDCMDVSADGKTLWVTNRWARQVSAIDIDSRKLVKEYKVGASPHGVYLTQRAAFK